MSIQHGLPTYSGELQHMGECATIVLIANDVNPVFLRYAV